MYLVYSSIIIIDKFNDIRMIENPKRKKKHFDEPIFLFAKFKMIKYKKNLTFVNGFN